MPRVGSSKMTTLEFRASHLPTTTFCWLPPDNPPASTSTLGVLIFRSETALAHMTSSFFRLTTPSLLHSRSRLGRAMFSRMGSLVHRPSFFRSSGASTIPALMASSGQWMVTDFPSRMISPDSLGSTPKIARVVSVRPAPISPAKPTISPAYTSKFTSRTIRPAFRFRTSKTFSPFSHSTLGNFSLISRPTMLVMISSMVVSLKFMEVMY